MLRTVVLTALAGAIVLAVGCKKPRKFVRTKQQQERVDTAILNAAPKTAFTVNADFDGKVKLLGIDVTPTNPAPGGKVTVDFVWQVTEEWATEGDWMVFVHVEGPTDKGGVGRVIADHYAVEDGPGGAGLYPPKEWKKGQIIRDSKTIDLVDGRGRKLGPGAVTIYAGLFDMEAYRSKNQDIRLMVKDSPGVTHDGKGRLKAATFQAGTGKAVAEAKPFKAPELQVRKAVGPITIDGKLDEPTWRAAVTTPALARPDGKPLAANMRTQVKMLWDDEAVYVGFVVRDDLPKNKYTKRDEELWHEDVVEVYLDPDSDGKNYVELQVSPSNIIFDALFTSRRVPPWKEARAWNMTGLTSAVNIGTLAGRSPAKGWTVEIRIPYADLAAAKVTPPKVGTRWKANFFRKELPGDFSHLASWSPVSDDARADFHNLDRAGFLVFAATPKAVQDRLTLSPVVPVPIPAPTPPLVPPGATTPPVVPTTGAPPAVAPPAKADTAPAPKAQALPANKKAGPTEPAASSRRVVAPPGALPTPTP